MPKSLPWSWYSDPDVLRREQERIFRRAWQYVGHTGRVEQVGDRFAAWAGDIPVLVVRAEDGVRAFLNVCRHRGSLLVDGEGTGKSVQCPYHAWTYDLDGSLRAAPRSGELDVEGICLLQLAVATWGPVVFVSPEPVTNSLEDALGPVPGHFAAGGIDVDALRFRRRSEYELACNWKIAVENYLECYHCAVAHPGFSQVVDVSPDAYKLETHALGSSQFGPSRNGGGPVEGQFHWLWPATKVYALPGPPNLAAGPVAPLGAERTKGFLDYFFPEDVSDAKVEELLAFDDQVGLEDRALVESVQAGVRSGLLDEGRLLPESEKLLAHFQSLVREALA
jgi:choline monooxygenase